MVLTAEGTHAGVTLETCALLDPGSTRSFCARRVVDHLGLKERQEVSMISTLLDNGSPKSICVDVMITGLFTRRKTQMRLTRVVVLDSFPNGLTETKADSDSLVRWTHLKDLAYVNRRAEHLPVEMLIGQDAPAALTPLEIRRGRAADPFAIRTRLGWAINGSLNPDVNGAMCFSAFVEETTSAGGLDSAFEEGLKRFWEVEDHEESDKRGKSIEDRRVVSLWQSKGARVTGHYQFPIPFREEEPSLPDNLSMALRRLDRLRARLSRDEALKKRYVAEMEELISKGYAEAASHTKGSPGKTWYLPHHPVLNPKKTEKTRIVFDCAASFKEVALNKQVMQGPDLMNDLLGILIRFREGRIALSADIEAMFHQVLVDPRDRDALRFLWWPQGDFAKPPIPYRMTRHLFGGIWSPACATFALRETLQQGRARSRRAERNFYVDDLLLSTTSEAEAIQWANELQEDLKGGGFHLTKWMSNSKEVMAAVPRQERSARIKTVNLTRDKLPVDRALGILWDLEDDSLKISVSTPPKPATRRGMLSTMGSVFDPPGFLAPFSVRAKIMFQDEVRRGEKWDSRLSEENANKWAIWLRELEELADFCIDRCIFSPRFGRLVIAQLHHFCDASTKAYAAVSYMRVEDDTGFVQGSFIMARTRLVPIKSTTVPRLELCAAVLAANSDAKLRRELSIPIERSIFWTDSMVVLQYIRSSSRRFHTFVANRLGVIHRLSSPQQWRHVRSEDNPADDATRGLSAKDLLVGGRWLTGPSFLCLPESSWPPQPNPAAADLMRDPEVKKDVTDLTFTIHESHEKGVMERFLGRYSSWYALQRAVAWMCRFTSWIMRSRPNLQGSQLQVSELKAARMAIIRYVQGARFQDAIYALSRGKLSKINALYRLEPTLDDQGVLRVGGRRIHEEDEPRSDGPILLPKDHHVTSLIVRDVHVFLAKHSGREHTLASLRRHYWVVAGRPLIDRILRNCFICRRVNSRPLTQRQGELPQERISAGRPPFTYTGVDCFGPFTVTCMRRPVKRFGCLFTCFNSRAVHIEMLHSLDADAFLNALMRFIARRGPPERIFSDRGTNFQRAAKDLRAAAQAWNHDSRIKETLHRRDIEWVFHPPTASHMGGVWERQIRSIRKILDSIIGAQRLDDDRLQTLFCEVEATLNSRPLTAAPGVATEPEALTPDHLLRVGAGIHLPLDDLSPGQAFRRRWNHAQALADRFWHRWKTEYLHTLRMRQRAITPTRNLQLDDLVLVTDQLLPRNQWRLGRVTQVFPGSDGLVRRVQLRTSSGTLTRPVVKLCLLEGDICPPLSPACAAPVRSQC